MTSTTATIRERLQEVFREVFNDPGLEIDESTTSDDLADWDSVAYISLIVAIEAAFDVRLIGKEIGTLQSAGDMMRLLERKLGCAGAVC